MNKRRKYKSPPKPEPEDKKVTYPPPSHAYSIGPGPNNLFGHKKSKHTHHY